MTVSLLMVMVVTLFALNTLRISLFPSASYRAFVAAPTVALLVLMQHRIMEVVR